MSFSRSNSQESRHDAVQLTVAVLCEGDAVGLEEASVGEFLEGVGDVCERQSGAGGEGGGLDAVYEA